MWSRFWLCCYREGYCNFCSNLSVISLGKVPLESVSTGSDIGEFVLPIEIKITDFFTVIELKVDVTDACGSAGEGVANVDGGAGDGAIFCGLEDVESGSSGNACCTGDGEGNGIVGSFDLLAVFSSSISGENMGTVGEACHIISGPI